MLIECMVEYHECLTWYYSFFQKGGKTTRTNLDPLPSCLCLKHLMSWDLCMCQDPHVFHLSGLESSPFTGLSGLLIWAHLLQGNILHWYMCDYLNSFFFLNHKFQRVGTGSIYLPIASVITYCQTHSKQSVNICGMSMGRINEWLVYESCVRHQDLMSILMWLCRNNFSHRRWENFLLCENKRHLGKGGQGLEFTLIWKRKPGKISVYGIRSRGQVIKTGLDTISKVLFS